MVSSRKLAGMALAAGLAIAGLTAGPVAADASGTSCGGTGSVTTDPGTLADNSAYVIQCPAGAWNGTLFLYSHGYVEPLPGEANPATDASDTATQDWLLGHGYAIAGAAYAMTGWAVQSALSDQIGTLDAFDSAYGKPKQTIAWGDSLGGMITAGLIQDYPGQFSAALPMCGVLSGGVATWNTALDAAFAFQQLIDPKVEVVNISSSDATANFEQAETALAQAQATPQGQARIALAAALGDTPGWFTTGSPEPASTDYTAQEEAQYEWDSQIDFPFIFDFRSQLESLAGGNPSWNTGVNYFQDIAKSTDLTEVQALYQAAGLNLNADLRTLNDAPRISADPSATAYLAKYIAYNGEISVPTLTVHTTGDGLVVPENEQAYRSVVDRAGRGYLLQQLFVDRAGHCAFTPAEEITSIQVLLNRLATGQWNIPDPATLNEEAAALGSADNIYPPAFISYRPARYLRPYDLSPLSSFFGGASARIVP
jgi:pimeloyl-ACP methyl ester carboxylesterase